MRQTLPYAIFRSGVDLLLWGVTKTQTEIHYLFPTHNCFFYLAEALRGKVRACNGFYAKSFALNSIK